MCIRDRELVGSAGHADKEACVPHRPEALGPGIRWLLRAVWTRISEDLLPGFRTATTLGLGPLFDILELDPFCHSGQKCSCMAPG